MKILEFYLPIILAIGSVLGFFLIIFMFVAHDDNLKVKMATIGLEECLVDSRVLWQKECGR